MAGGQGEAVGGVPVGEGDGQRELVAGGGDRPPRGRGGVSFISPVPVLLAALVTRSILTCTVFRQYKLDKHVLNC